MIIPKVYMIYQSLMITLTTLIGLFSQNTIGQDINCPPVKKFLHFSDIHIDLDYKVGAPTHCVLGSTGLGCCRNYDIPLKNSRKARKWGETTCDSPIFLMNETFKWIRQNIRDLDFVLYGGDTIGHHDISQSESKNIRTLQLTNELFHQHFKDLIFLPNQGNHDTYPIDQTPPLIGDRIRREMAKQWAPMVGTMAAESFSKTGFYNYTLPNGLEIISIDTLDYDSNNLFKSKQIAAQDRWVRTVLEEVRNRSTAALIHGHIPPGGGESTSVYNDWITDILITYKDYIRGAFFGHSHKDQFYLYGRPSDNIVPALVSPSMIPDSRDPCFRIYEFEPIHHWLTDYTQYCIDLEASNILDTLQVYLSYRASSKLGLPNLSSLSYWNMYETLLNQPNRSLTYCQLYFGHLEAPNQCQESTIDSLLNEIKPW